MNTTDAAAPAAPRPPGRPRSEAADEAILEATVALYGDHGFEGLSMDAVAARAGVSKATIYRRYPSKVELVMAAAVHLAEREHPAFDTGSVRDDLCAHVRTFVRMLTSTEVGRCLPTMVADKRRSPELADAHHRFSAARRAPLIAGPVFYSYLVSGRRLDRAYADAVVDAVLLGSQP